jgi:hypothetical protein
VKTIGNRDEIFEWGSADPELREQLVGDVNQLQNLNSCQSFRIKFAGGVPETSSLFYEDLGQIQDIQSYKYIMFVIETFSLKLFIKTSI